MQEARAVHVEAVQPIPLENLALRCCCEEAWVLSGKQQVAKENQQVRAVECEMSWRSKGGGPSGLGKHPDSDPSGSKGCDSAPGLATATPVPD